MNWIFRAKLYELFALIEKEFDALHAENTARKCFPEPHRLFMNFFLVRLQSNTDRSGFDTPITNTNTESYAHSDLSFKTTSKKSKRLCILGTSMLWVPYLKIFNFLPKIIIFSPKIIIFH